MSRFLSVVLRLTACAAALLFMATPADAGGWATVRLDVPLGAVEAGQPLRLGFMVMQHDVRPYPDADAILEAQHKETGQKLSASAFEEGPEGHYVVEVAFPEAGNWKWSIIPAPFAGTSFETLPVHAKGAAPLTTLVPSPGLSMGTVHPAAIHRGTCAAPAADPAIDLEELRRDLLAPGATNTKTVGPDTGLPVASSVSTIDTPLADLVAADHALTVRTDDGNDALACGDLGGLLIDNELAVGLRAGNGAGPAGIALLRAEGDRTEVAVYLTDTPAPAPTISTAPERATVRIHDDGFEPASLEIGAGTLVTWTNAGGIAHTVTGDDLAFNDSAIIDPGQSFAQRLETSGTYTYKCGPHEFMVGTITVK